MFKILVSTEGLSHEQWLSYRKRGIGGSDASVITGLNPFKTPMELYLEKTDQIEPKEAGEAAYWGNVLEDVIMNEFTKRTGIEVGKELSILEHPEYDFMLANLDGLAYCRKKKEAYVFEAKTCGAYSASQWQDGVPDHYQLQLQHYLAVTGLSGGYVAALIGGQTFKYYFIERDDAIISMLIELEKRFWHFVKTLTPPPDSEISADILNRLYLGGKPDSIILPESAIDLVNKYESAYEEEKKSAAKKDEACNKLKSLLQNNEIGRIQDKTVMWKRITTEKLDTKKLKAEHPEIYNTYTVQSTYRRFTIK